MVVGRREASRAVVAAAEAEDVDAIPVRIPDAAVLLGVGLASRLARPARRSSRPRLDDVLAGPPQIRAVEGEVPAVAAGEGAAPPDGPLADVLAQNPAALAGVEEETGGVATPLAPRPAPETDRQVREAVVVPRLADPLPPLVLPRAVRLLGEARPPLFLPPTG